MNLPTKKTTCWMLVLCVMGMAAAVRADDGSLTPKLRKSLRDSFKMDQTDRALLNAVTAGDVKAMVLNRQIVQEHNNLFTHKIDVKGITNQKSSGRCWMFASLNLLRPVVIEKRKLEDFEFSESYLAFWDKLEKANCFLEDMIALADREPFDRELDYFVRDPINDGGWWSYTVALIEKYGVVPKEIMPETHSSGDTTVMNGVLARKLRADAMKLRAMHAEKKPAAELRKAKREMLAEIYRILVLNYGRPPGEFTYRYKDKDKKVSEPKTYTPQSFYKEWVDVDLKQYINVSDDPCHPYWKHYRLRRVRNIVGSPEVDYVNAPSEVLRELALKSVLDDEPVLFGADAMQDMDRADGIMDLGLYDFGSLYGVDLKLSKAGQLVTREGASNHAMVFVGVDMPGDKPVKWLVENSWGKERGDGGYWTMYDRWFDQHVYSVIVKKKYVSNKILKILKQEAVELPPWAPMNARTQ